MAQQQNSNHDNSHNANTPSRQTASYPSPQGYPSPSMTGYAYPPPTGQSDSSYRASPTGSNVSLPSLNLPPIRTIDGRQQPPQQQSQQPQGGPPTMPPALPPPMNHQYYPGHTLPPPPHHMNITSDPNQPMRYPLPPPPDGRIMSGGRHKKEIKRRTKTGCLTCRKRRIKCDEAHPACRNCQKSKRECLGYDPIFKAQPGPTNIQPAPIPVPNMQNNPAGPSYPPPPQGYMPPGTHPYAPPLSASANSPRSSTEPYNNDYGAAIDPALAAAGHSSAHDPHGKRSKIDELCAIQGIPPPPSSFKSPLGTHQVEDIKSAYARVYAPAIDKFFETRWFTLRGLNHLLNDARLCELFSTLLLRLNIDPSHHAYYGEKAATQSLEATIIWGIMGLARLVANNPNPSNGQVNYLEINDGVQEAAKRFEIFETLILGQHLDAKPEPEPKMERNGNAVPDQLKIREKDFWRHVHTFLALHDDEASAAKEIDDTLASCRSLLDSRENRDVIYSIIIARHIGQRLAEFPNNLQQPSTNDEADNKNKLHVAKSFLETQQTRGTNQVVQRMCNMVVRSWSLPR